MAICAQQTRVTSLQFDH